MPNPYLQVLKKRNFLLLWFGQIVSQFGDKLTQMALIGLVYKLNADSPLGYATMFTPAIIPVFLLSSVAGIYVDRWNKQKIMYISDFLRGICTLFIPILLPFAGLLQQSIQVPFATVKFNHVLLVYIILFLSFCIGRFFVPAKMAIIPSLVDKEDLLAANSLTSITAMIAAILGVGLGGVIVEKWGVKTAFYIDAGTFFISSLLIFFMRIKETAHFEAKDILELSKNAIEKVKRSFIVDIKEGLGYLIKAKETRYASKIFFILFACLGSLYTVFIVFIQQTFMTVTKDLGGLAVGLGTGLFIGSLVYGRIGHKFPVKKAINTCLLCANLYLVFFATFLKFHPWRLFAFASCFILGVLVAPIVIAVSTLIHQESKNELWGRIFSSLEIIIHLALLVFMFLSSYLAERMSPFTMIVAVGIITAVFALVDMLKKDRAGEASQQNTSASL